MHKIKLNRAQMKAKLEECIKLNEKLQQEVLRLAGKVPDDGTILIKPPTIGQIINVGGHRR